MIDGRLQLGFIGAGSFAQTHYKLLASMRDVRLAAGYLGMLTAKDNPELRDAVVAALQQLVDSGAYVAIMKRWGLEPLAVTSVKFNDAASLPVE